MTPWRAGALAVVVALAAGSCQRARAPGFPPPARPAVLVELGFDQAFASLSALLEARSFPVLVADEHFGSIRTDWIYFDPGEVDLTDLADCHLQAGAPPPALRVRYGFEVRRRANRSTVTILTQYQAGTRRGFDEEDVSWLGCPSTGEWERLVEQTLTQRGTIR
jgi:hypothetical protein